MRIRGRVWVFGDNINTDLMYPNTAFRMTDGERRRLVFSAIRPGWADQVREGDLIVGGLNFGTGSGRPAAKLLRDLGVAGLVAESINGLFFRNSINYALPCMECPGVKEILKEGDVIEVDFATGEVRNVATGLIRRGEPLPELLLNIVRAGGLLEQLAAEGYI